MSVEEYGGEKKKMRVEEIGGDRRRGGEETAVVMEGHPANCDLVLCLLVDLPDVFIL